jgi:N-acetylglucosamine-6-phosphate deacetylase
MVSANPASALGLKNKGRIEEGYDADLVLLDRDMNVRRCWVGGICRYVIEE